MARTDIPDPTALDEAIWALYAEMRKTSEGAPWAFAAAVGRLFPQRAIVAYQAAYCVSHREQRAAHDASHREQIAAQRAAYCVSHREQRAAYDAAYRASKRTEAAA